MLYECYIHKIEADLAIDTTGYFTQDQHGMSHWKYVLCCFSKCPIIVTPNQ